MSDRKYGICLQPCTIQLIPVVMNNTGCLSAGSLFQIQHKYNFSEVVIKRPLYNDKRHINYENELYICFTNNFKEIDYRLFLILLAVKPEKRLNLIHDDAFLAFVRNIHINQRVLIPKTSFHGRQNDVDCVLRYIGPVPEIGLGIFFGLILVDPLDSIPIHGTLATKYLRCDNSKGFLRAVDVFHKRSQPIHNQLRSFPSVSSIDPYGASDLYGSMESLSSERSFGNRNNRRHNRNNNHNRNQGLPVYNATNPNRSGMNLIEFEPVNPNILKASKNFDTPRPLNVFDLSSLSNNLYKPIMNNLPVSKINPMPAPAPLEYQLLNPEVKLQFTPVPNTVVQNIIQKSNENVNRDKLRQKYEILKKEFEAVKNAKINRDREPIGSDNNQASAISNKMEASKPKYNCSLNSCKFLRRSGGDYRWDGKTEFYTNSVHQIKCFNCQELKLRCYTSKFYGANREYHAFITLLQDAGFNVSVPQNKYLAITDRDKTKVIDNNKRDPYYSCAIRSNITINKNRYKSRCRKCKTAVGTSQGISLATCHHLFCTNCIKLHIHSSDTPEMKCPDIKCEHKLVENDIHAFMNETEFQSHLKRLLAVTKCKLDGNLFYCKNKECNCCIPINQAKQDKIVLLVCPECGQFNCIDCNTIHTGISCDDYQRKNNSQNLLNITAGNTSTGARTKNIIFKCKVDKCRGYLQIQQNETINLISCPECNTINCRACEDIHTKMTCREYQRSRRVSGSKSALYNDDQWVCSGCTYIHNEKANRCQMCYMQRGVDNFDDEDDDGYEFNGTEDSDDIESVISIDENQYEQLLALDDMDIIRNTSKFKCITCFDDIEVGKGIKLHDCLHEFCEDCLTGLIKASDQAPITCPFRDDQFICEGQIQHREMKYLVDEVVYEQYLYRSLLQAQKELKNCFQCKTPDCRGMWEYEDNVATYECPLCSHVNCHQCNAVHGNMSCRAYQQKVYDDTNPDALATRKMYDEMFATGKALRCPQCAIVIVRDEGCSWVVCAVCKTEICWATRGPRWGPNGKGDTSGGCKCDFKNGKLCHPKCEYCH